MTDAGKKLVGPYFIQSMVIFTFAIQIAEQTNQNVVITFSNFFFVRVNPIQYGCMNRGELFLLVMKSIEKKTRQKLMKRGRGYVVYIPARV